MNKAFIGLLVVAAATGAFFFLRKKDKPTEEKPGIKQELIIGSWKAPTGQTGADSAISNFRFDFLKDGIVLQAVSDTVKADTVYYAWTKPAEIMLKKTASDSTGTVFTVNVLQGDSLQLQTGDNLKTIFTRVK